MKKWQKNIISGHPNEIVVGEKEALANHVDPDRLRQAKQLLTSNHRVTSSDPTLDKIVCEMKWYFIEQTLYSPDMNFIMPPTSKKLRGHIGLGLSVCPSDRLSVWPSVRLSVCPSVRLSVTPYVGCKTREPLELGTWNFIYSISTKNKRKRIFFFFGRPLYGKVMPLFRLSHKNLVNTITWERLELGFSYLAYGLGSMFRWPN